MPPLRRVPALAAGYDDYAKGIDALHGGNADEAITLFGSALSAGDLAAAYLPEAYYYRAQAYLLKKQCPPASADLDAAIKLKGDFFEAYEQRAVVDACLNKADALIADLTSMIALKPQSPLYAARGYLEWNAANFAGAQSDFAHALQLGAKNPYLVLWFGASAVHVAPLDASTLAAYASAFDSDKWPGPLLDLYRGKLTVEQATAATADANGTDAATRKCQADFFVGEWQATHGAAAAAKAMLLDAVQECPAAYPARAGASAELKRLQ